MAGTPRPPGSRKPRPARTRQNGRRSIVDNSAYRNAQSSAKLAAHAANKRSGIALWICPQKTWLIFMAADLSGDSIPGVPGVISGWIHKSFTTQPPAHRPSLPLADQKSLVARRKPRRLWPELPSRNGSAGHSNKPPGPQNGSRTGRQVTGPFNQQSPEPRPIILSIFAISLGDLH